MRWFSTSTVGFALISGVLAQGLVGTAQTDQPDDPVPPARTVQVIAAAVDVPTHYSPEQERDLSVLAAEQGLTQEEARRRYGWQDNAAFAITQVKDAHPGAVAYARMASDPTSVHVVVAFKAAVPDGLDGAFAGLPVPVELVSHVGYSETEFTDAIADLHYSLIEEHGTTRVSTSGNIETGQIEAVVDNSGVGTQAKSLDSTTTVIVGNREVTATVAGRPHAGGKHGGPGARSDPVSVRP